MQNKLKHKISPIKNVPQETMGVTNVKIQGSKYTILCFCDLSKPPPLYVEAHETILGLLCHESASEMLNNQFSISPLYALFRPFVEKSSNMHRCLPWFETQDFFPSVFYRCVLL